MSLGLSGNTLLDEGVKSIAPGVGQSSIEELRIQEAGVTAEGAAAIVEELNDRSRRLVVLDMDGNAIDDQDVLEEIMAHNTSVASHDTTSTSRKQTNAGKLQTSQHSAIESVADNSDAERGRQSSSGRSVSSSLTDTCAGVGNVTEEKADECRSKEEPRKEKA